MPYLRPSIDGLFVPDDPVKMLVAGCIDEKDNNIIAAQSLVKSPMFTDPRIPDGGIFYFYPQGFLLSLPAFKVKPS